MAIGWTLKMRQAFPNSALLISQAVGHGTGMPLIAGMDMRNDSAYIDWGACHAAVDRFWAIGELPLDGMICRQEGPVQR